MTEPIAIDEEDPEPTSGYVQQEESKASAEAILNRREKRKASKKEKRKQIRKELAEKARAEEEARLNDPEEQLRIKLEEERENERLERERREFEEREKLFLEELARKKAEEEEEERIKCLEEESKQHQANLENESNEDDDWEYVEGPPEVIFKENEIIFKKNRVKVKKLNADSQTNKEDADRPTSNPLPPQSEAFADYKSTPVASAQQLLDNVAQQVPNFGTEQDKAHCPFHIKTGACRFGPRCSRVHFYPDKSCTLLLKNMYNGPGLAWEQDEGLEHTDEEVERCYEEFYEDVHTELLKFGEIVNFKVCRNGSFHLRGNVYVHYKSLDSAVVAYCSINGRYFAGKQVNCEFVSVTRWKVAICGEYMKSRFKTCSRGTACNFIHCFRNPGGDYEWADWDKPPPRYWTRKMVSLFGFSDESFYDKQIEQEGSGQIRISDRTVTAERDRYYYSRRSRSRERDRLSRSSSNSHHDDQDVQRSSHRERHKNRTKDIDSDGDWSDRGEERKKHRDRTTNSSKHRKKSSEISDDSRTGGFHSDEDRERRRSHRERKKSPGKQNEFSVSPNGKSKSRSRTRDSEYTGDKSDGSDVVGRNRRREVPRNSKEDLGLSDDYGESEKINRRVKPHSNSTKWDRSSVEKIEPDLQDEKKGYRESEDKILGKRKRYKRKHDSDDDDETCSGSRYSRRNKSHDTKYYSYEKADELDRWKPEIDSPEKKRKSRSSSGENMDSVDKTASAKESKDYEDDN